MVAFTRPGEHQPDNHGPAFGQRPGDLGGGRGITDNDAWHARQGRQTAMADLGRGHRGTDEHALAFVIGGRGRLAHARCIGRDGARGMQFSSWIMRGLTEPPIGNIFITYGARAA